MTDGNVIGSMNLTDLGLIAIGNVGSKTLLSGFIGDDRLKSGAIKTIGAVAISMVLRNNEINKVAIGIAIDGIEDLLKGSGLVEGIGGFARGVQAGFEI